jgi:two-component system, OmpR family, phosphate regulon sensor histidine kinase PhoR
MGGGRRAPNPLPDGTPMPEPLILLAALLAAGALGAVVALLAGQRRAAKQAAQLRRTEEQLRTRLAALLAEQELTQEAISAMGDGVLVLDEGGRVLRSNAAAARLLRASGGPLEGTRLVDAARSFPALPLLDRALVGRAFEQPVELAGPRHLMVQVVPLRAQEERRVLLVLRDETQRVRTERMRTDFVANLSHELKTPLARLGLLTSTLAHAIEESPADARDFLGRLEREVEQLSNLVDDLLTLSRVEERGSSRAAAGRAAAAAGPRGAGGPAERTEAEPIDLAEVARRAAASLQPSYDEASMILTLELRPTPVCGDPVELETAARNLLDNARRYSEPGGNVYLHVAPAGRFAVLMVRDQGVGIPRDERQRIFERFYRVDKARSRETGGTGLGLSIVRNVVEQHGGTVGVESAVGVGSTFTIRLPLAPPAED